MKLLKIAWILSKPMEKVSRTRALGEGYPGRWHGGPKGTADWSVMRRHIHKVLPLQKVGSVQEGLKEGIAPTGRFHAPYETWVVTGQ